MKSEWEKLREEVMELKLREERECVNCNGDRFDAAVWAIRFGVTEHDNGLTKTIEQILNLVKDVKNVSYGSSNINLTLAVDLLEGLKKEIIDNNETIDKTRRKCKNYADEINQLTEFANSRQGIINSYMHITATLAEKLEKEEKENEELARANEELSKKCQDYTDEISRLHKYSTDNAQMIDDFVDIANKLEEENKELREILLKKEKEIRVLKKELYDKIGADIDLRHETVTNYNIVMKKSIEDHHKFLNDLSTHMAEVWDKEKRGW